MANGKSSITDPRTPTIGKERFTGEREVSFTDKDVTAFRDRLLEDKNLQNRSAGEMLNAAINFLGSRDADFLNQPTTMQIRRGRELLQLARGERMTAGEITQETLDFAIPALTAAAGTRFGPFGVSAGGAAGPFISEAAQPLTTGQQPDFPSRIPEAGANALIFPMIDRIISGAGRVVGRIRSRKVVPNLPNEDVQRFLQFMDREAPEQAITATQIGGAETGSITQFMENVAVSGIGGRRIAEVSFKGQTERLALSARRFVNSISPHIQQDDALGRAFLKGFKGAEQAARAQSSALHSRVDELTQGVFVDTKPLIAQLGRKDVGPGMKKLLDNLEVLERTDLSTGAVVRPGFRGEEVIDALNSLGRGKASFETVDRVRSSLLEIARDTKNSTELVDRRVHILATRLAESARQQLVKAGQSVKGGEAARAFQEAKRFHREEVVEEFENKIIRQVTDLVGDQPSRLAGALEGTTKLDHLLAVKEITSRSPGLKSGTTLWDDVRAQLIEDILQKGATPTALGVDLPFREAARLGRIREFQAAPVIQFLRSRGDRYTRELFGKNLEGFKDLLNAIEKQNQRPEGPGRVVVALTQAGEIIGGVGVVGSAAAAVTGVGDIDAPTLIKTGAGSALILMTPRTLAKTVFNKQFSRNLREGLIGGPTSAAMGRFLAFAGAQALEAQEKAREVLETAQTRLRPIVPTIGQSRRAQPTQPAR